MKQETLVNEAYITAAKKLTREERLKRIADTDEAIAKGASRDPNAQWPDEKIKFSHPQTPLEAHWTRHALRLSSEELVATREAILALE